MLTLILGDFRTGKTEFVTRALQKDTQNGRRAKLIVPEQETVERELALFSLMPPAAPLTFEVTNFSRLADTVFRAEGGVAGKAADAPTRALCMWKALSDLGPLFSAAPDKSDTARYLRAVDELRAAGVTPDELAEKAALVTDDHLKERMRRLSAVAAGYSATVKERFTDTADVPDRLAAMLREKPFFRDTEIYVDGFTSFTEQEYRVLAALIAAGNVTVTLCLPDDGGDTICYEETQKTREKLTLAAHRAGAEVRLVRTGGEPRLPGDVARGFCALRSAAPPAEPDTPVTGDGSLLLCECSDPFDEADFVAADIRRRVMAGARYRDFAVVAGNAAGYAGILDAALEKAEIPFFFSVKEDLEAYETVKLIHSAYAVVTHGWRREDVIGYLKCGGADVPPDDRDLFELYTETWKLHGEAFRRKEDWDMNPDGYTETFTDEGRAQLDRVNGVRRALLAPLADFAAKTAGRQPVKRHATLLYGFLLSLDAEARLASRAAEAAADGRRAEAERLSRLFGVILGALDRLCDVMGEAETTAEEFHDLLSLVFAKTDLGSIPSSLDEVTIGTAETFRAGCARFVYLFGVTEGEFPVTPEDDNYFSENDRSVLCALDLPMQPKLMIEASRARFCFLRAMLGGKDGAMLLWHRADASLAATMPSSVIGTLQLAFGGGLPVIRTDELPPEERLFAAHAAADAAGRLSGTAAGEALLASLRDRPEYGELPSRLARPIENGSSQIRPGTVKTLYPGEVRMTQSRLEKYTACPFAFFCTYGLSLREENRAEFTSAAIGTYVHLLMENFFNALEAEGRTIRDLPPEEVLRHARECAAATAKVFFPERTRKAARSAYMLRKLERLAELLIREMRDEFVQSRFLPVGQEVVIGEGGGPEKMRFRLSDGTEICFGGTIDRIDAMHLGDDVYLRVVDYKTGVKEFRRSDVAEGKNLQVLLYLAALWKSRSPEFLARIGCGDGGNVIPACVEYLALGGKEAVTEVPVSREEALEAAKANLTRAGLALEDEVILAAMDDGISGRYLPGKISKEKLEKCRDSLFSLETLGELLLEISEIVTSVGESILAGNAETRPAPFRGNRGDSPCTYCPQKPVCRNLIL